MSKFRQWVLGEEPDFCDNTRANTKTWYNKSSWMTIVKDILFWPFLFGLSFLCGQYVFPWIIEMWAWFEWVTLIIGVPVFIMFLIAVGWIGYNICKCTIRRTIRLFIKK